MMPSDGHVVLLGDSIFDNGAYTRGEPAVIDHLRVILPTSWHATLCAVDGSTTRSIGPQLRRVPVDGSHVVVAIGGNDALGQIDLLDRPVSSTRDALMLCRDRLDTFGQSFARALDDVLAIGKTTIVCTIYNGSLDPSTARVAQVALAMFNGVILEAAVERRVDVIELRQVCNHPEDYANPIEPSGTGGRRIAESIARAVGAIDQGSAVSRVYGKRSARLR